MKEILNQLVVDVQGFGSPANEARRLAIENQVKNLVNEYKSISTVDPDILKASLMKLIATYNPVSRTRELKDIMIPALSNTNVIVLGPEGHYEGKGVFKVTGKYALVVGKFAPNSTVSFHQHPVAEYFFVLDGSVVFTVDGTPEKIFTLHANEWKKLESGTAHGIYSPEGCKCLILTAPSDEDFPEGISDIEKFLEDNSNGRKINE